MQLIIKALHGHHVLLNSESNVTVATVQHMLREREGIPENEQVLMSGCRHLSVDEVLCGSLHFLTLQLRVCGGKQGAFGQSLRGQKTRPGARRCSNFDSCRTLDGRRLRHVKKEQQLISWKQQKLEEMKTVVDKKPEEKPVDNISESVSKWLEQEQKVCGYITDAVSKGLEEAKRLSALRKEKEDAQPMPRKRRRLGWDELEEELFGSESDSEDEMEVSKKEPEKHEQHPHPLVEMPNPYGEYCTECDVCGNQITDTIFHCEDCKWDACPSCYAKFYQTTTSTVPQGNKVDPKHSIEKVATTQQ